MKNIMGSSRENTMAFKLGMAPDAPRYAVAVVLLILVLSVYWQVGSHAFITIDDNSYVSENTFVRRGLTRESVSWAFTTFHAGNWHPLTWLSHMIDMELFGPSPAWHLRMNVLFHLLNTELLFVVLWRMTGGLWQSALAAALFGVHPLHVESVAWVAERKDVLSALFWILTMGAYLRYARRPTVERYLLVAATLALGLMCKPMLVTLPFVLLLLDWWPLGRAVSPSTLSRLAREKLPLLALSAASCVVTYLAQAGSGTVAPLRGVPLAARISNACVSYAVYLAKTVWPSSLAVFYPHPWFARTGIPAWHVLGSLLLVAGISCLAFWQRRPRPYLAVGWLWYLGTLVPVIGLVQVGGQAMADRYSYIPLIGIFIAVAWGIPSLSPGRRFRQVAAGALGAAVVALSAAAWSQAGYWRDSTTLFSRALAVTERNWFALTGLGAVSQADGRFGQAIGYYREALRIKPDYVEAWNNLGLAHKNLGQFPQAIASYREALRIGPDYPRVLNNLGSVYGTLGQLHQAIGYFRQAVRSNPDYAEAWNNLGAAYDSLGQTEQAAVCYREAFRIRPDYAKSRDNLGAGDDKLDRSRRDPSTPAEQKPRKGVQPR